MNIGNHSITGNAAEIVNLLFGCRYEQHVIEYRWHLHMLRFSLAYRMKHQLAKIQDDAMKHRIGE